MYSDQREETEKSCYKELEDKTDLIALLSGGRKVYIYVYEKYSPASSLSVALD